MMTWLSTALMAARLRSVFQSENYMCGILPPGRPSPQPIGGGDEPAASGVDDEGIYVSIAVVAVAHRRCPVASYLAALQL
jgi:hypothetical protein